MINVKVYKGNEVYDIKGNKGEILVEVLKRNGINVPMLCGGRGRCKKCAWGKNNIMSVYFKRKY